MFIFAYRLGDFVYLCFLFLSLSTFRLGSHLTCTFFHLPSVSFLFLVSLALLFIIAGWDFYFGLGSLTGGPTAEGYVAVFPCTISVLVYKTWQDYWERIEEGEEDSDTMPWPS